MSDNDDGKSKIKVSSYFLNILLGSVVIYAVLWFFDPGPVLPPFDESFSSIDCRSVKFIRHKKVGNKLFLYFRAENSVEYPTPYLPHFLYVAANSSLGYTYYEENDIKNLSRNDQIISLSIDYPIYGRTNFSIMCLNQHIHDFSYDVQDLTTPETDDSASLDPYNDKFVFERICVDKDIILYFTPPGGEFNNFVYDDQTLRIHVYPYKFSDYASYSNITIVNDTAYVVSKFDLHWWKAILFSLGPLTDSISRTALNERYKLYTLGLPQPGNTVLYGKFNSSGTVKFKNNTCYKRVVFVGTKTGKDLNSEEDIRLALKLNYTLLRKIYVKSARFPKRIVLPSCMSHLEDDTRAACPSCEISLLSPHIDIPAAADNAGRATVLVGNHLNNIILSAFLEQNNSALVDVSPEQALCVDWAQDFVQKLNISYFPVHKKPNNCNCTEFSCLSKNPPIEAEVDREAYKQAIMAAVNATMNS